MDRFSLKGKTALVTGAERGIGLEIAKGLAAAGADIIIAGLMKEEFPKAEAAVRAKGVSCTVLKADISKDPAPLLPLHFRPDSLLYDKPPYPSLRNRSCRISGTRNVPDPARWSAHPESQLSLSS